VFTSTNGVTFGFQLLGALLFWIPRSIWVDKPIGSGELVAEYSGYSFTNIASPLWAEAYINAGLVGVILAFFAYGVITSWLQNQYLDPTRQRLSLVGVLVPLLAAYQMFFIRGELQSTFAYLVPMVGYLILSVRKYASYRAIVESSRPKMIAANNIVQRSTNSDR
jgi:hypothetical protein